MNRKIDYYLGVIKEIYTDDTVTKEFGVIIVDIPGFIENIKAYPKRTTLDEPKVGDAVLLTNLDPLFNSYMIYEKLKEDDFIGFRSTGKIIDITPDYINIGVFDQDTTYTEIERPECHTHVQITKDGQINIYSNKSESSLDINVNGNVTIESENGNILLGSGATHELIKGDLFKNLFNSHTHSVTKNSPTTGTPITRFTDIYLSNKTKTE